MRQIKIFIFRHFILFLIFFFAICRSKGWAQEKEFFALSAGTGALTFYGDVGNESPANSLTSSLRSGFSFSIEKYFAVAERQAFSLSLNLLKGNIAADDKSSALLQKQNFESPVTQIGINGTFFISRKGLPVIPFLSAGFSFLHFSPYGDLQDERGNTYYYWKDGSIRNLPEEPLNFYAQILKRDYRYETKLDSGRYTLNTFSLPLAVGIKIKFTPNTDLNLGFSYHLAFSDFLDNIKSSANDKYLFSSASLTFHIYKLSKKEHDEIQQIFAEIDRMDSDKDGVVDANDLCPGTPEGVKTDNKGCPIDSDADGVPDHLDQQPNSKGGLPVDAAGVELTKDRLVQLHKESVLLGKAAPRSDVLGEQFNKRPSTAFLKAVEEMQMELRKEAGEKTSVTEIPYDLRIVDRNKDNFISADEIAKTIDAFFEGSIIFSAEQINRLIVFFFEQ